MITGGLGTGYRNASQTCGKMLVCLNDKCSNAKLFQKVRRHNNKVVYFSEGYIERYIRITKSLLYIELAISFPIGRKSTVNSKQLLDEVFVISGIIKVEVSVISRSRRLHSR